MKILVCGGRDFANPIAYDHSEANKPKMDQYKFLMRTLDKICLDRGWMYYEEIDGVQEPILPNVTIISGVARGVDSAACDWAACNWTQLETYPADWKNHARAAGPIRNQLMLKEGKPDLVVAFPGGTGTADMVRRAKKAGVEVIEVKYDPTTN